MTSGNKIKQSIKSARKGSVEIRNVFKKHPTLSSTEHRLITSTLDALVDALDSLFEEISSIKGSSR